MSLRVPAARLDGLSNLGTVVRAPIANAHTKNFVSPYDRITAACTDPVANVPQNMLWGCPEAEGTLWHMMSAMSANARQHRSTQASVPLFRTDRELSHKRE